jgi:hypothetical protein
MVTEVIPAAGIVLFCRLLMLERVRHGESVRLGNAQVERRADHMLEGMAYKIGLGNGEMILVHCRTRAPWKKLIR